MARDWRERWEEEAGHRGPRKAADTPILGAFDKGAHLGLYEKGYKAQTSVIIQMRTGKIGLAAFLYYRKVPGQPSPACACGRIQTVEHLFVECNEPQSQPLRTLGYTSTREAREAMGRPKEVNKMAAAMLRSGWLPEFRLAEEIREEVEEADRRQEERIKRHLH